MNCMTLIDTGKYIGIFVTKRKSMAQYHVRNFPTEGIFLDVAGQSIVNRGEWFPLLTNLTLTQSKN